nr:aspartate--ammonia ligase [Salisaeta longa]
MITTATYTPVLGVVETQRAAARIKRLFGDALADRLSLIKISAPKALRVGTGLQDDLAGTQEPVSFHTTFSDDKYEMVHSLAKWKRAQLARYDIPVSEGVLTDMHAIRKDESISEIHSVHVDQWDWEQRITAEQRTLDFLRQTVRTIYDVLRYTESEMAHAYPDLAPRLPEEITFIHTETLAERYPDKTPKEREDAAARAHGSIFVIGIGAPLPEGDPHDLRAADYDDWTTPTAEGPGLNGDIVVWDDVRGRALELSSMGIRVDPEALKRQLKHVGREHYSDQAFHKGILDGSIPPSIGGGIGQSRVCMFMLRKAHIGEVQASIWSDEMRAELEDMGIPLL